MKKTFLTIALMALTSSITLAAELSSNIQNNKELQIYLKEPFNAGGIWINSNKQILWKHPVMASRPIQTAFMAQPDQQMFVSILNSAGIKVKDNGKGFAEISY